MRPPPRVKFIWGASKVIRGRWYLGLFGFYIRIEGVPDSGLAISLRGLLGWLGVMAVVGYVALASALAYVWNRNPYSKLTYSDALLYPLRRAEIVRKKGEAFNAQGQDFFREKKYHEAANLLRLGLARQPHDPMARATLAQYYLLANQRPIALRVLQEGLTDQYPGREYLQTLFTAAEQSDDHERVVEVSGRYLSHVQRSELEHDARWLVERRFVALSNLGRHEEALQLAESAGDGDVATELRVTALLGAKRPADALKVLAEWEPRAGPTRAAAVVRLSVRAHRELGQFEEMERMLQQLRASNPAEPAPLVFGVVQRAMGGRAVEAQAALDDYVFRFGGSVANLILLAEPLAQIHEAELLERCVAAGKERGFPLQRLHSLLVETRVHRGEWDAAARLLALMPPETGRDAVLSTLWREWILKLGDVTRAASDASQLALVDLLRQRPWPVAIFRKTVEALVNTGRFEAAREVLVLATRAFPASTWFQERAVAIEAQLAAQSPVAPAEPVAEADALTALLVERPYWETLDALVTGEQWSAAARHVQAARSAKPAPAWLAGRDAELRLAQVRVSHGVGDRNGMIAATRLFLNGDEARSQQIVDVAKAIAARGDKEAAVTLARELLRRVPDFEPARALRLELQPPAKEGEAEK